MEPSGTRAETEYEPVAANPFRGAPPWERAGSGWKRGLAGISAIVLTAGSIAGVSWLAFRDDDGEAGESGDVISERCTVTEADDNGPRLDPMQPGTPPERSIATITTNYGDIDVMLWGDLAPCGVEAFTHLTNAGYYNGHDCDRLTTQAVSPTAILHCGRPEFDPESDGSHGPGWRFEAETDMAGVDVADVLALTTNESGYAGSAFTLIRGGATPTPNVSVIGGIVDGYEVLDTIAALSESVEYDDTPPVPVEIVGVQIAELTDLPSGPDTVGDNETSPTGPERPTGPIITPPAVDPTTATPATNTPTAAATTD